MNIIDILQLRSGGNSFASFFPIYPRWIELPGFSFKLQDQESIKFTSRILNRFSLSSREQFTGRTYLVASSQNEFFVDEFLLQGFVLFETDMIQAVSCKWYSTGRRYAVYIQGLLTVQPVFMNKGNVDTFILTATQVVFNDVLCIMIEINLNHEKIERRQVLSRYLPYRTSLDPEYEVEFVIYVSTNENPIPQRRQYIAYLDVTELSVISGINCVFSLSPEDQVDYHIIQKKFDEPAHFSDQHIVFEVKRIGDNKFTR
jgi:hypothetical protein